MPVSPDYAMGLARSVRDVYEKAEDRLIRTIAAQVAAGVQAESWQDAKLESITRLMREIGHHHGRATAWRTGRCGESDRHGVSAWDRGRWC